MCDGATPVGAMCRVVGSTETFDANSPANQTLAIKCTIEGLLCLNQNQTDNATCDNYEIQFTCDGEYKNLRFSNSMFSMIRSGLLSISKP